MSNKNKALIGLIFLFLLFTNYQSFSWYLKEKKGREQSQENTLNVYKNFPLIKKYLSESGNIVQVIKPLLIDKNEFRELLQAELINLNIRSQRVENFTTNNITAERDLIIHLKDSILNDTVRSFQYVDQFDSIFITEAKNQLKLSYSIKDSITCVIYKGKRKNPLLWIFSPRQIEAAISNKNPHVKIKAFKTFLLK